MTFYNIHFAGLYETAVTDSTCQTIIRWKQYIDVNANWRGHHLHCTVDGDGGLRWRRVPQCTEMVPSAPVPQCHGAPVPQCSGAPVPSGCEITQIRPVDSLSEEIIHSPVDSLGGFDLDLVLTQAFPRFVYSPSRNSETWRYFPCWR